MILILCRLNIWVVNTLLRKYSYKVTKAALIVWLLYSASVMAEKSNIEIGVGLMAFNYAEYDDDNIFLDGETGFIPGTVIKFKKPGKINIEWVTRLYYNKVNYDGETQITKIPVTTTSDAFIVDTHIKLGKKFAEVYQRKQELYTGLGYRYWLRNILPSVINAPGSPSNGQTVAGLFEEYYWFYGLIGYKVQFAASDKIELGFDFRLTKMINAKIAVDYLGFGGYDKKTLNLGNKYGARLSMPVEIKTTKSVIYVTPYFEIIDIGKSNGVDVAFG